MLVNTMNAGRKLLKFSLISQGTDYALLCLQILMLNRYALLGGDREDGSFVTCSELHLYVSNDALN